MNLNRYKSKYIKLAVSCLMVSAAQNVYSQDFKPQTIKADSSYQLIEVPVLFGPRQTKATSVSATSNVSGQTLNKFNTPKLANSFYGQLSGLHVTQTAGAPGDNDNPGLSIRGRQTFQDNSLVVLVDGFETDYNNLNPDEIESVSVLKDAASLSIYGLDGANGVVLIKTKRGKPSPKNEINFNARFGVQEPTVLPNFLGNGDYAELYNIGLLSDGKDIQSGIFPSQAIVDFYKSKEYPFLYPDVNWYDEVLKPNTSSQNYGLSFRGGKEDVKYFVALNYLNQGGLYANTDPEGNINSNFNFKRYNIRANFDVDITSFLTAQVNLRTSLASKKYPNVPESEIWNTLGKFNLYPVRTQSGRFGGTPGYAANPVASILQKGYGSINDRTVDANVKIVGKLDVITPGLSSFIQVNENNFYYSFYNKTRGFSYEQLIPLPNQAIPGEPIPYNRVILGDTDNNFAISQPSGKQINRATFLGGFEYSRAFGKHKIYASSMYYQDKYEADASAVPYARQNIMGRLNYAFQNKYLAEFNYAYSGSESFPKGNRFGFFPGIGAGWVLSEEGFLKNNKNINFLKLRGSVGLTGSDRAGNSGRFIYNQYYVGTGNYFLGNNLSNTEGTYGQGALANPNVTYEKALKYDFGIDASFFNSLNLTANYFYEARKDIFLNPSNFIPAVIGTSFYNVNRGQAQSGGVEVELNYSGKINNFGYSFGGNFTYTKNKIIDIAEPVRADTYLYAKGNPINQPFLLQAIGYFKDQADIASSPQQLFGEVKPGDVKYKDQNNDGFIDDNDRIPVGNPTYPSTWYGINAGFNFKGFDFNILFQGVSGRDVSILSNIKPFINNIKPTQWLKDNYWTPERGDNALFPRLTTQENSNNYQESTLWQRSGDFLRLRNVELGYTLPKSLLNKVKISEARLYISGNNLYTWDQITEINVDPEILNTLSHPALKSYNVGLTITL